MQTQFSKIEPLFFALESSHQECRGVEGRLRQKGFNDIGAEKLSQNVAELINRWKQCKAEITRWQTEIKDVFDRLSRFKKNLDKHVSFLDQREAEFEALSAAEAETSHAIQRKIDNMQNIKEELNNKKNDFEQVCILSWNQLRFNFYSSFTNRDPESILLLMKQTKKFKNGRPILTKMSRVEHWNNISKLK